MPPTVRYFSKSVRDLEGRLSILRNELDNLPAPPSGPKGGTIGYHSVTYTDNETPVDVTVDLESVRNIEAIVIVPANVVFGIGAGGGYGFPKRFRVEVAEDIEFERGVVLVADHTSENFPNPGTSPVVLEAEAGSLSGRYVKITATELWSAPGLHRPNSLFALGELLVFSKGRNVAAWKKVVASNSIENRPLWSMTNLVDGQSSLGIAIKPATESSTNGYHSSIEMQPEHTKWVQVDLGEEVPVDEVRLFPARPVDFAESHGFGFPVEFRVECSNDADFSSPTLLFDSTKRTFTNPGDNSVPIPVDNVSSRYVRVTATRLWRRTGDCVFALSELQVISEGENVAASADVSAADSIEVGFWSQGHLVDGYDSQNELLIDELDWLKRLQKRHQLELQMEQVRLAMAQAVSDASTTLVWLGGAVGTGFLGLAAFLIIRSRSRQKREIERIRQRIAGDLHDEIGSNLGSIALLSEIAQGGGGEKEISEITRIARETGESMRDIVWITRGGRDSLPDLLSRMREIAGVMLKAVDYSFEVAPDDIPKRKISLDFKRNILLFFKEALHNAIRHSGGNSVSIETAVLSDRLVLNIRDHGCGFNVDDLEAHTGSGLKNLKNRAASLNGWFSLDTNPGEGTQVTLRAPL